MTEFPSNSKNSDTPKPAEKIVEQVISSEATSMKRSLGRRFRDVFIGGDTSSVVNYVVVEVLLPQAKAMLAEAVSSGFERLLYGDSPRGNRRYGTRSQTGPTPTNYTRYADKGNNPVGRHVIADRQSHATVRTQSIDDILLASLPEAETVMERMYDLLRDYEAVSVADLYNLLGWSSNYVDQKWGWTDLHGMTVRKDFRRNGWILILPKTMALDT